MNTFPFDDWLRVSVTIFRIPPHAFWAMSVRDWLCLTTAQTPDISPQSLRALMAQFPDMEIEDEQ